MRERVFLLAEFLLLLGADAGTLYSGNHDAVETLRELPRSAVAAGILFGGLFLAADLGFGTMAALFGGLVVGGYVLYEYNTLAKLFNTSYQGASGQPGPAVQSSNTQQPPVGSPARPI